MFMISNKKCIVCEGELNGNRRKFCSTSCNNKYKYFNNKELLNSNSYARQVAKYRYRKFKLIELRGNKGCENCGYINNIGALDFHHINNKEFTLDSRTLSNKSWCSILEEFSKCVILCSNCHREHHNPELKFLDRGLFNEISEKELKPINKCVDCNSKIDSKALRCFKCNCINSRTIVRPSIAILLEEISISSYLAVGRKYGVSDNSIRKWIKKENLSN